MDNIEREQLFHKMLMHRKQPGIVREWVDVEFERRIAAARASLEWEEVERRNLEWEAKYILDMKFQAEREEARKRQEHWERERVIAWRRGIRLAKLQKEKEMAAARKERKRCEQILGDYSDKIAPWELARVRKLERGRKVPRKPKEIYLAVIRMRSLQLTMPRETLWSMEMAEHTRMAYLPFKVCDREFSQMKSASLWGQTPEEDREEEFPDDDSGLGPAFSEEDEGPGEESEW